MFIVKESKKKPQPFMLCVACLFSAWNFYKLLKALEAPLPHYGYNKSNLHISNFLQRHFFLLCQEGVGRRGVNQINVCWASRMLVIVDQDSNLCDHMRDRDSQSATLSLTTGGRHWPKFKLIIYFWKYKHNFHWDFPDE